MNFSYFFILMALALNVVSAQAQTSLNTTPLGMIDFPLLPDATTYLSLPLETNPVYTGAVAALTATTLTVADSPAPWTASQFVGGSIPYFVKILSGAETGRIMLVTANGTSTVTLDTTDHSAQTTALVNTPASTFDVQTGDTFEIFPGETISSIFGLGTPQSPLNYIVGGTSVSSSDVVTVFTLLTAPAQTYYFNTTKGYWTQFGTTANDDNAILYPHSSLAIGRRGSNGTTTTILPLMGTVTNVPLLIKTASNNTTYTSSQYPADIELSQLQLGPNWKPGASVANADVLSVWDAAAGHFDAYYQIPNPTAPDSGWREYPNRTADAGSFIIPAGAAISIAKREIVSGAASYLQPNLPYTLN